MTIPESSPPSAEHTFVGFEAVWPEIRMLRNRAALLTALIAVVLATGIGFLAMSTKGAFVFAALILPACVIFLGNRYVQQKVSEKLMLPLAATISVDYSADGNTDIVDSFPDGLLPYFNVSETKDVLTGEIGKSSFLSLEVIVRERMGSGTQDAQSTTYFAGVCVVVKGLPQADPVIVARHTRLGGRALHAQMAELTGHRFKKVEQGSTHAPDLDLYILKASQAPSVSTNDFLRRLANVDAMFEKKDFLFSAVRTDHTATLAIDTQSNRLSLGGLLMTRPKLLIQMDRALDGIAWPIRLVEAFLKPD